MRRFKFLMAIAVPLLAAGCAGGIEEVDFSERQDRIETRVTYRDLVVFAQVLADKMRSEQYFINAVHELKGRLDDNPALQVSEILNDTDDDTLPVEALYDGFEEAFYTSDTVTFVQGADAAQLQLRVQIRSRRNYGESGKQIVDYMARVKVHQLMLPDSPSGKPYWKLIGTVSEPLRLIKGGRSLL